MSEGSTNDERILAVLREVMDPELHDNIVDLGMVRSAYLQDQTAHVTIALTTAGCPLRATIKRDCESRVTSLSGIDNVQLHWDELTPEERSRAMDRARSHARASAAPTQIPARTRVISVASGKGGVGKSTVTVNLASAFASQGFTVGVLDADIWGFSIPRMLGVDSRLSARPANSGETKGKIVPVERREGSGLIKLVSTGLMVDTEETALMWRGLMLAKALEQFLHDVDWGELDYLLIDMPPGTGDVQMALARLLPQAQMLVITTPALNAQKVAVRVADMARRSHMPVLGVIENMSAFVTPDGKSWALFGEGGGQRLADEINVPLLGSIPLEPAVSSGGDNGRPVALGGGPAGEAFQNIASQIVNEIFPPVNMEECSASSIAEVPVTLKSG